MATMLPTGMLPGLLSPEQEAQLNQQAQRNALLNFGLQALAGSQAVGYKPGTLQVLGQAGQSALQGYQGTFDQQLQNMLRQQQLADAQRQRQAEADRQAKLGVLALTAPEGQREIAALFPEEFVKAQLREPKQAPGDVGAYEAAIQRGIISPNTTFEQFVAMKKPPAAIATAIAGGGQDLTPGQKKLDESFAPEVFQWQAGGGQDMTAQIAQLQPVINALEAGEPITGVATAVQPDLLLALTNPKALQAREAVEEVVQRNLRVILGAQFTEKEGERLISRAFNPKLPPEENAKRVRRLFKQMETAATQKQQMVDYFNQNGTLKGFQGRMPSVRDFENAMEKGVVTPSTRVKRFNPATGRIE